MNLLNTKLMAIRCQKPRRPPATRLQSRNAHAMGGHHPRTKTDQKQGHTQGEGSEGGLGDQRGISR